MQNRSNLARCTKWHTRTPTTTIHMHVSSSNIQRIASVSSSNPHAQITWTATVASHDSHVTVTQHFVQAEHRSSVELCHSTKLFLFEFERSLNLKLFKLLHFGIGLKVLCNLKLEAWRFGLRWLWIKDLHCLPVDLTLWSMRSKPRRWSS